MDSAAYKSEIGDENLSSSDGHIALYIDGSCLENQNVTAETPAAWGMAIVVGDNGLGKVKFEESWDCYL